MSTVDIVKRRRLNHYENFDRSKLHSSITAICICAKTPEGQAQAIADLVCKEVEKWLENRQEITSNDIRVVATRHLRVYHPDAAYLYEQHRIMI